MCIQAKPTKPIKKDQFTTQKIQQKSNWNNSKINKNNPFEIKGKGDKNLRLIDELKTVRLIEMSKSVKNMGKYNFLSLCF